MADQSVAIKAHAEIAKAENDARMAELEYQAKQIELEQKQRMAAVELEIKMVELDAKRAGVMHSRERHETQMYHDAERHVQEQERELEPAE